MKRLAALLFLVTLNPSLQACTIPVFRYALERWSLAPYEMVVFHKGKLSAQTEDMIRKLDDGKANFKVTPLDINEKMPKDLKKLWESQVDAKLPWAVIRGSEADEKTPVVWAGSLDPKGLQTILHSPVRQKLVDRLQKGDSACFLVLEGGSKEEDDKAIAVLDAELARLEKALQVPEQSADGPQLKLNLPLKIAFSVVRMSRKDAKEEGFLRVLLSTEEGLDKIEGPIVFPVFGRGRALCSMYGKDMNAIQLKNVARFLCGECSCQVKELNPGVDLLLTADWAEFLERVSLPSTPLLTPRDVPEEKKKK